MKASQIIAQLLNVLPRKTSLFSSTVELSSLSYSGGVVTGVTPGRHKLETGSYATISGALTKTQITSLTLSGNIATAVTATDHDLTEGWHSTVSLEGADQAEYNGEHTLLTVTNRRTFTFSVSGSPASPATGDIYLLEDKIGSFNGLHQVTVIDPYTFTYPSSVALSSDASGTPVLNNFVRVSGAVSVDRALDAYTEHGTNELWAFVVLGDVEVSRDRSILSDADIHYTGAEKIRIREIESFSVFVFIPSSDSIAGRESRDQAEDVKVPLYQSLMGLKIGSPFNEERRSIVTPIGDRMHGYNKAVYIHEFQFQTILDLIKSDGVDPADNAAFRDMTIEFENDFDEIIAQTNINLDEVPL